MSCWMYEQKVDLGCVQQPANEIKATSGQRECKYSRPNYWNIFPVSQHF